MSVLGAARGGEHAVVNRLDDAFARERPALICYLPLGDPAVPADLADVYVECGVDVLEIGVPAPNPYLDGPAIRDSMDRARAAGVDPRSAAELTARLRERHPDQAAVWMSYGSLVEADELVALARRAEVDAMLFPEPARHFEPLGQALSGAGVHLLHFLSYELPPVDVVAAQSSGGYLMLQAIPGVTGSWSKRTPLPDGRERIDRLRAAGVDTPIALGVGISTPRQAAQAVAMGADGVIVGSTMVERGLRGRAALRRQLRELRQAVS